MAAGRSARMPPAMPVAARRRGKRGILGAADSKRRGGRAHQGSDPRRRRPSTGPDGLPAADGVAIVHGAGGTLDSRQTDGIIDAESVMRRTLRFLSVAVAIVGIGGCASLLPHGKALSDRPFGSYVQAQAAFDRIEPYKTSVATLRGLGIDPAVTPNVTLLNYSDIIRRLLPPSGSDVVLDPGIRDCLNAQAACRGYEIDQQHIDRKRVGNFWLDFLDFRRETTTTGWRFDMLLLIVDGHVVYKLWGGQPDISTVEATRNPLGPLQGFGVASVQLIR